MPVSSWSAQVARGGRPKPFHTNYLDIHRRPVAARLEARAFTTFCSLSKFIIDSNRILESPPHVDIPAASSEVRTPLLWPWQTSLQSEPVLLTGSVGLGC